jgi:pimeloyl-ACP methyl ester carboxylesterase/uncharacterized membrane protein
MTRVAVATHVLAGLVAVLSGAVAMLAAKGSPRHRLGGRIYCLALAVLVVTGGLMAAPDWAGRWHLFLLGVVAFALAALGDVARLARWRGWARTHIAGMGGAYIAMLTAFYVDNGPRLPLWRLLPPLALWLVPAGVGLPVLFRALRRYRSAPLRHGIALALLLSTAFVACSDSQRAGSQEDFALQPGEPGLDAFSRQKIYVPVGPWRVAYIDEGQGAPVLLLHGCPFHAFQWRELIPQLRGDHRVLAPDLLGLGDTQVRLSDDYSLPRDAEMIVGFMDALGIPKADFVASDHGAATLQLLMRDHPERIRRAVITNAEAYDQWPSRPERPYLELVVSPWLGPIFRLALHSTWVQREVFGLAVYRKESLSDEALHAYTRALIATPGRWKRLQRFFRGQLDPENNQETMRALDGMRRFENPTLILWGRQDTNFGPEIAERLAGDIPGVVGVEYLEESAHLPFQEEPRKYGAAVLRFLGASSDELQQQRRAFRAARAR